MKDTVENLVLDLLEWLGRRERTYQNTMEAWRTSCPRLPIWEDASDRGLVEVNTVDGGRSVVRVAPAGLALLKERRPQAYEEFERQRTRNITRGITAGDVMAKGIIAGRDPDL